MAINGITSNLYNSKMPESVGKIGLGLNPESFPPKSVDQIALGLNPEISTGKLINPSGIVTPGSRADMQDFNIRLNEIRVENAQVSQIHNPANYNNSNLVADISKIDCELHPNLQDGHELYTMG